MLNPVCIHTNFEVHANSLSKAIQSCLLKTQNADISDLSMDAKDTDVLHDIHQIIEVPHVVQELLSSERTPTLSMALPAYEVLNSQWTHLQSMIWELSHYIDVGLDKLKQYINEGRKMRIYTLSMSAFQFFSHLSSHLPNYSCQPKHQTRVVEGALGG